MTNTTHPRELLKQPPAEILASLPAMGRVMLSARSGGATHERMGAVGAVTIDGNKARLAGEFHDSTLDLSVVIRLVADRTSKMRDRVLPRLECQDAAGDVLFSLIGLDGVELFDKALAPFGPGEALEPVERESSAGGGSPDVPEDDLGAATFAAILRNAVPVSIDFTKPGLAQHWRGALPEPKPAMGFVNIMQGAFHLHLRVGAVTSWLRHVVGSEVELVAHDADGQPFGLVLRGPAAAFDGVSLGNARG
ncbi:hypothetical protein FG93_03717 [Bosea sp. LC85]|uniref:hypothetical protein n=1 Tax=Bosea sp. LC85 TaxID=1502851 RepID=UPI0004E44276|nr:hypothetical protein [Bosea sp. LC85]KFC68454.1 hypothetical protein FG93_03717 [Bosea sp. LC85]